MEKFPEQTCEYGFGRQTDVFVSGPQSRRPSINKKLEKTEQTTTSK